MWWSTLVCLSGLFAFQYGKSPLDRYLGSIFTFFPTTLSKSKSMTQVNCSHPVRQDIVNYDISFNSVMARGRLLVPTALQRRLDLIETRCVEEVTELLELAQQLLLRPDALKKFRDQEYMICGKRYVWLDWWEFMRYEDIRIYIYIFVCGDFSFYSLVVIHLQLETRGCMCADSDPSGGWQLQKYWPRRIERNAELGYACWGVYQRCCAGEDHWKWLQGAKMSSFWKCYF